MLKSQTKETLSFCKDSA